MYALHMSGYKLAIRAQVRKELAEKNFKDLQLRAVSGAVCAVTLSILAAITAHILFNVPYASRWAIGVTSFSAVGGAALGRYLYKLILWINYRILAPGRIWKADQETIRELADKLAELTATPAESKLSAELSLQNDLAELVIRNTGVATTISARWKKESHTPNNLQLLGMPLGYQEMAFAGGSATAHLDAKAGVQHLCIAECQIQGSSAGPGNPPIYGWTLPYLHNGNVTKANFPSGPTSLNPGAPYARLIYLVEVRPHSGLAAASLVYRIALQGRTCLLL